MEQELLKWVVKDSICFLAEIAIVFFFCFYIKSALRYKISLFFLLLLVISSYNILVIPFHYYHLFLPRTFVYENKILVSIFSGLPFILLSKDFKKLISFVRKRLFMYYISLGILASVAYFLAVLNDKSDLDRWMNVIRYCTNIYLLIISSFLFYILGRKDIRFYQKFIKLIVILIFVNILSLSLIPSKYLWIKLGLPVKVFDQSDQVIIFGLILLIISNFQNLRKRFFSFLILAYSIYGSAFKSIFEKTLTVPLCALFMKIKGAKRWYIFNYFLFYSFFVLTTIIIVGSLEIEHSIRTRYYQILNFFLYLRDNFYFFLIGFGPFKSFFTYLEYPPDLGAWDIKEKDSLYKAALQVPVVADFRNTGILGLFLKFFIIYELFKYTVHSEKLCLWKLLLFSYIAISILGETVPWSPKISIYTGFFLSLLFSNSYRFNLIRFRRFQNANFY